MNSIMNTVGNGDVIRKPDIGIINAEVAVSRNTQAEIVQKVDEVSKELESSIEEDFEYEYDMRSRSYNIGLNKSKRETDINSNMQVYNAKTGREISRQSNKYLGIHSYSIETEEVDKINHLINIILKLNHTGITGIKFDLSNDTYKEARQVALKKAVQNAKEEARSVSSAENMEIKQINEITVEDVRKNEYERDVIVTDMPLDEISTSLHKDRVSVRASVSVEYKIE